VLTVLAPGLRTLVVEAPGRVGWAHLGVPRSGPLDPVPLARANALVGNPPGAAGLECLLRGPVLAGPHPCAGVAPGFERRGTDLDLSRLPVLRCWVAVAGGVAVAPVLGSRTADTLGGLGPPPLSTGDVLPVGDAVGLPYDAPLPPARPAGPLVLLPGPDPVPLEPGPWTVLPDSDRTALRLEGPARPHGLPGRTRGLVPGAVQVPPDGRPVVFLAGHPTTGGYPVAGFVPTAQLGALAQLRPGATLTLHVGG